MGPVLAIRSGRTGSRPVIISSNPAEGATYGIRLGPDADWYAAKVLKSDPQLDCAILALETQLQITPLPLATSLEGGDEWVSYGNPEGIPTGLINGVVTDPKVTFDAGRWAIQLSLMQGMDGTILRGSSGSPVLVKGAVVGHLTTYISDPNDRSFSGTVYVSN